MYKVLLAALVGLTVSLQAFAANSDNYTPEYKAYASFSFGGSQQQSLGLHYGLRMDHDSREQSLLGNHKPAIAQVDFSAKSGFESARIYGMPLTAPTSYQMNLIGDDSTVGRVLWFSSYVVIGGIIYWIHELSRNNDPAKPATTQAACAAGMVPDGAGGCKPDPALK